MSNLNRDTTTVTAQGTTAAVSVTIGVVPGFVAVVNWISVTVENAGAGGMVAAIITANAPNSGVARHAIPITASSTSGGTLNFAGGWKIAPSSTPGVSSLVTSTLETATGTTATAPTGNHTLTVSYCLVAG